MIWDFSPIATTLHLGKISWPIYWYGVLFGTSFIYGILFLRYLYRREGRDPEEVYELALYFIFATLIGARLGHVLFYDPHHYLTHPLEIFQVWKGGMASHGTLIGVLIGMYFYARRSGIPFLWIADRIGLAIPISGVLIRIGNFMNSEILGRPTDVPWGVIFLRIDPVARHPVQLYESIAYLVIFMILFNDYLRRSSQVRDGWLLGKSLFLIFTVRFFLEFFKQGQAAFENGWPVTMGQWLSLPVALMGVLLMRRLR